MIPGAFQKLVVVASSTAGPPALRELLGALPADFPAPILLVQHTLKDMTRQLAEQLAGYSALPVCEAREGEFVLPGRVLLAPGDWHLELRGGEGGPLRVHLQQGPKEQSVRPAADVLFRSAARWAGREALGLVLTGLGEDGLAGARAIVAAGGKVWAQERSSAVAPSMPGKVCEAGLASFTGTPLQLGQELVTRLHTAPVAAPVRVRPALPSPAPARTPGPAPALGAATITGDNFRYLREFLRSNAGITMAEHKDYFAAVRLAGLAGDLGLSGADALVARLRAEPSSPLAEKVVDELTINETSFFRDAVCFELLHERLVPALLTRARCERRLRIWSAACSTGEEPYSVAMGLRTRFPELSTWKLEVRATDISRRVLAKAAEGRYSAREIGRGLPRELLERWFVPEGRDWRVAESIRSLVRFEVQNLQKPFPSGEPFDLVFLRNVLIYFDDATKHDVLLRITRTMRSGSVLVLGSADALRDGNLPLRSLHCEPLVAYSVV